LFLLLSREIEVASGLVVSAVAIVRLVYLAICFKKVNEKTQIKQQFKIDHNIVIYTFVPSKSQISIQQCFVLPDGAHEHDSQILLPLSVPFSVMVLLSRLE
jgi:hypothetical protein